MRIPLGQWLIWSQLGLALTPQIALAAAPLTDSTAVVAAIEEYHEGFRRNVPGRVSAVLGPSFTIFNGNFSGDPRTWEVHLYLAGPRIAEWPVNFLREAGPYENRVQVVRVHLRGDGGLVVTEETGRNRFRQWDRELVTYTAGTRRRSLAAGRVFHQGHRQFEVGAIRRATCSGAVSVASRRLLRRQFLRLAHHCKRDGYL